MRYQIVPRETKRATCPVATFVVLAPAVVPEVIVPLAATHPTATVTEELFMIMNSFFLLFVDGRASVWEAVDPVNVVSLRLKAVETAVVATLLL